MESILATKTTLIEQECTWDCNLILAAAILVSSYVVTAIPSFIKKFKTIQKIFPYITLCSAGYLISVILVESIHPFLPHEMEGKHEEHDHAHVTTSDMIIEFAIKGICALISFTITFMITKIVKYHVHCKETKARRLRDVDNNDVELTYHLNEDHAHNRVHGINKIGCAETSALQNTKSKLHAIIILMCISLHSVLEAFVFVKDNGHNALKLGLFLHKILESFIIGTALANSTFSNIVKSILALLYTLATPIGIIISNIIASASVQIFGFPLSLYFDGFAFGSIFYVIFAELIPDAFHGRTNMLKKSLTLVLSILISGIIIFLSHMLN